MKLLAFDDADSFSQFLEETKKDPDAHIMRVIVIGNWIEHREGEMEIRINKKWKQEVRTAVGVARILRALGKYI